MISVVIPAFNEEVGIKTCLNALAKQDATEKFEVIVVNNGSTDNTKEVVMSYSKALPLIRVVDEPAKGRGTARATGFEAAKGDIILSTDADTIVPAHWVSAMTKAFQNPKVEAITGLCTFYDCPRRVNIVMDPLLPIILYAYRLLYGHFWLSGFNFGIRKDLYHRAGGFAHINAQEDTEFSYRVAEHGKIHYLPLIRAICSGRRFKNGLFRGLYEYMSSFTQSKRNVEGYLTDVRE